MPSRLAKELGLGARINIIMQTAFFEIAELIPPQAALGAIKKAIQKTYGSKGEKVVNMNIAAVDAGVKGLHKIDLSQQGHQQIQASADCPERRSGVRQDRHGHDHFRQRR